VLHSSGCVVPHNNLNWENFAPLRVRVFFWILRLGRTRTRAHLSRLGCVPSPHCPFCPGVQEDLPHLFVRCPRLAGLWARAAGGMVLGPDSDVSSLLDGLVAHLPPMCPPALHTAVLALLWSVWKSRNTMVFDSIAIPLSRVVSMVGDLRLWVVRAPSRVDLGALLSWCDGLS
jgi:hypothetical protein